MVLPIIIVALVARAKTNATNKRAEIALAAIEKNSDVDLEQFFKKIMNPVESDEFDSYLLGKQWAWHANYDEEWGMTTPDGFLRLFNYARSEGNEHSLWTVPNLLLQKTPADVFTATAKVRVASKAEGQWAGLLMMGLDYSGLVVKRVGDGFELQRLFCKNADRGGKETFTTITALVPTSKDQVEYKAAIYEDIYLRMVVKAGGKVTFYYSPDGKKYTKCGEEFKMREGKWIGAKMGFVSIEPDIKADRGWIDVDWFRVTK